MDPLIQVGLREGAHAPPRVDVEQVRRFHAVADGEGDRLEYLAAHRVLAGERLDDRGELGEEEREERPDEDLRYPPAARRSDPAAEGERPVVERLHVLRLRALDERAHEPVHEARVDVLYVRVYVDDDVAGELVDRLPQVLALAAFGFETGEDVAREVGVGAEARRDLERAVVASRIDHHDLVEQRIPLLQLAAEDHDLLADRLLFVERGDTEADRKALLLLRLHERAEVAERRVMIGIRAQPLI